MGKGLKSSRVQDRKRALKSLVADGSPAAWREVFTAFADPESEVGDDAQLWAAKIEDPSVAEQLTGRAGLASRELGVRLRAAEALGRVACTVDVALLLRALDDRESEVAHLALWSVERLARAQRIGGDQARAAEDLERAARGHRDGYVRAAAICARGALFAKSNQAQDSAAVLEMARILRRCGEDRDPRVRCAAAMACAELPRDAAVAGLAAFARDERSAVRLARIESLERIACAAGAAALVNSLEFEPIPRARRALVAALQRLSGLKHRDDVRPWRDWVRDLPSDWRPTLLVRETERDGPGAQGAAPGAALSGQTSARPSFVGLQLTSTRICFAIDFSGSMWTPMPDGRMPKELVDARLRSTLESLDAATHFNVVPFTNEILPWRPKLVPANPGNVRTAIADFEDCKARGRGNFFDAAVFALDDPEVETLVSLTDGVPTGGFHSDLDLVLALLLERNRFRRVTFDTVLVDAPPASERRFRTLAEASGGCLIVTEKAE